MTRSWKRAGNCEAGRRREEAGGIDHGAIAEYSRLRSAYVGEQAQT